MENRHTKEELRYMQSLPLDLKIRLTEDRIRAWVGKYGEDGVYVSFSGGKDSTVLLDIVRNLYPNVKAVFSNTGLEYPEIRQFAMAHDNVDIVYPDVRFKDVITQYGYPLIGKEVAEAIYYARRIGGGLQRTQQQADRTSRQKKKELVGARTSLSKQAPLRTDEQFYQGDIHHRGGGVHTIKKRTEFRGTNIRRENEDGTNSEGSKPG